MQTMRHYPESLLPQIHLIEKAMKEAGVWSPEIPEWVIQYNQEIFPDVWQWLQFIYLPLRLHRAITPPHYLAPIVSPYMLSESHTTNLLQLIIELDSISSTLEKK